MSSRTVITGSLLCLIAAMSWGAMFPVAHRVLLQLDPFYFSFIRYFIVAVILSVLLWFKEGRASFRLEGKGKPLLFLGTMAFTVYNMGIFLGQQMLGEAGIIAASIMEVLMPMITVIVLWVKTKRTPAAFTLVSVGIAFVGALLVITRGDLSFFAMAGRHAFPLLLIFVGVLGWVIYSIGGARFTDWSILRYSTLTCLLGTGVNLLIVASASALQILPVPEWQALLSIKYELAFMSLLPGLAALLCWNAGIKRLSPTNGILFINMVPITTFGIMALQGYSITAYEFYGTLLIIFALLRDNLQQRLRTRRLGRMPRFDRRKREAAAGMPQR